MSSASMGGSGINQNDNARYLLSQQGELLLNNKKYDLTRAEDFAELKHSLNASELTDLKHAMLQAGFTLSNGVFVPKDDFAVTLKNKISSAHVAVEINPIDQELDEAFRKDGVINPYNPVTTEKLFNQVGSSPEFSAARDAVGSYLDNPSSTQALSSFQAGIKALQGAYPNGSYQEMMYLVLRESIKEINEDKKYFLDRLLVFNKMGEALSENLRKLTDAVNDLEEAKRNGSKDATVDVNLTTINLDTLDADGNVIIDRSSYDGEYTKEKMDDLRDYYNDKCSEYNKEASIKKEKRRDEARDDWNDYRRKYEEQERRKAEDPNWIPPRPMNSTQLSNEIKNLENTQETLRNQRQTAQTSFTNFDEKSQQCFNILNTNLKIDQETRRQLAGNLH